MLAVESADIFPWNENLATGIPIIDEQHRQLVNIINLLANHLSNKSDLATLNDVFDQLAEYADYHFQTEELIWHEYFPEDSWEINHKKTHKSFIDKVLSLKSEDKTNSFEMILEDVLIYLTRWLAFHILDTDTRMATVVLMMQSGVSLESAKQQAENKMEGATKLLIRALLQMYENHSHHTLELSREIKIRRLAEARLRLVGTAFETTLDAICITDANANVIEANSAFTRSVSPLAVVIGKSLKEFKSGLNDEFVSKTIWSTVEKDGHWCGELRSLVESGEEESEWLTLSVVKNEQGKVTNYVGVFSNIRHLLKLQQNLQEVAYHDALTGLPNRLLLADHLKLAIANTKRAHCYLAVCYLDLDGFKPVNDQFGHDTGDYVLKEIAHRLQSLVRSNDTVSRLGGDEFVMILGDLKAPNDYSDMLDRVLKVIQQPIQIGNNIARVSASIGLTIFPADDCDAESLVKHADAAMYEAKHLGKSRYCLYTPISE
jgi:diguanylate cyclase (GGDEF)-like protein/hemerythrin-like metal-binding protein/PAS domain S-box-containing protein